MLLPPHYSKAVSSLFSSVHSGVQSVQLNKRALMFTFAAGLLLEVTENIISHLKTPKSTYYLFLNLLSSYNSRFKTGISNIIDFKTDGSG